MAPWQNDLVSTLESSASADVQFSEVAQAARNLGFDFCAYGVRLPLPASRPKMMMHSNYPDHWQERYLKENYLAQDPSVVHCSKSNVSVLWTDSFFANSQTLWSEARSIGLNYGWAQSCCDAVGARGMLTLARTYEEITPSELEDKFLKMFWLTQVSHLGLSRSLLSQAVPDMMGKLSAREIEVLRWTADGKTSSEISEILNISERTVNFHIANAIVKLNATNKTSATIRAALLGMLS